MNFKVILSNYMNHEYVKNTDLENIDIYDGKSCLPIADIYIGMSAENFLKSDFFSDSQKLTLKLNIRYFYIELLQQMKKRFDFGRADIKNLNLITPGQVLSSEELSIVPLMDSYPHLIETTDVDVIITQWKLLRMTKTDYLKNCTDLYCFWEKVENMENGSGETMFKELTCFEKNLMCLPHSSASAERTFYEITLVKNKLRNLLQFSTINNIMLAKELCDVRNPHYVWSAKDFKLL